MKRPTIALMLASLMIFGVAGCGDDEKADDKTELESDGDKASDTTEADSSDDSTETTEDSSETESTEFEGIPDMGDLGDCMTIGLTYASLGLAALGGEDEAKEAVNELKELQSELPKELEDDIAVIAEAYGVLAEEGFIDGADALDTDEYKEADANIQAYLDEKCGG